MTTRTVQLGMSTYTDVDGVRRIGVQGERVDVDPGDVTRFDRANGTAPEGKPVKRAAKKTAPRKKAAPRKRT